MKLNANRLLNYKFSSNNINFKKLKNFNKFPLLARTDKCKLICAHRIKIKHATQTP